MDQEEIAEIENDPEKLRMYLKDYYSKTNPEKSDEEIEEFVRINSATGGRIGFNEGTNMKMASMDENERELMRLVEEFMERGFSQQEAIEAARDELERLRNKFVSAPDPMDERNSMMETLSERYYGKPLKDLTPKEIEMLEEAFDDFTGKKPTTPRMMAQTGGITESRVLPPEFIEAAQRTFLTDLATQAGMPSVTTADTQQPGETDAQFAQRKAQAQQFGIRRAGMAELAPQVAAQDPYQAAAYAQATDPSTGFGVYQPFLTAASQA